jgi:pimeloyl-ACP methyl ester carboxylesterase
MARSNALSSFVPTSTRAKRGSSIVAVAALALAGAALLANRRAAKAERDNPARGTFVTANGLRLHYVERGSGAPIVFLHGNGAMVDDMLISGLVDRMAQSHRAIAFDRPGFGHTERPRGQSWDAAEQAALLPAAFARLGIERPIVVGHSWGTLVALALALNHPEQVSGLVLASGYYYPTLRADSFLSVPAASPWLGDLICHTAAPLLGEVMAPGMIKKMFAPQAVTARFDCEFPVGLTLRPSQIRAFSQDAAQMASSAEALSARYGELSCPLTILAGDADEIVDFESQALRLHKELPGSTLDVFNGAGHMLHHLDTARVVQAVLGIEACALPSNGR